MNDSVSIKTCVSCESENWTITEKWQNYTMATCSQCGLTFTTNPDYQEARYVAAYEGRAGEGPLPQQQHYVYDSPEKKLQLETYAFILPPPRLTPAEKIALGWFQTNAPKRSLVIDCGCGTGRYMRSLERAGFRAVGIEVSEALTTLLSQNGFEVVHGTAPEFPWTGPDPFAITLFEVLEHIPLPGPWLRRLKDRFPNAKILASVPSPFRARLLLSNERGPADFPPHHYLRWTPEALKSLFVRLGYAHVDMVMPPPSGSEFLPGLGQIFARLQSAPRTGARALGTRTSQPPPFLKRAAITAQLWTHRGYHAATNVVGALQASRAQNNQATAASMLVIAQP